MLRLHDGPISGNSYKPRLLMALLKIEYERLAYDLLKGETRTEKFLALNPAGKIPALELEDGHIIAESNAILFYLADGTPYFPADSYKRAKILEWMFFEQNQHEANIAVIGAWHKFYGLTPAREAILPEMKAKGEAALALMEGRLSQYDFLVGKAPTIADIALFPYTKTSPSGGFDLTPFPAIQTWLQRIESLPHYIPMTD